MQPVSTPLKTEVTLPNWIRKLGKWRLFFILLPALIILSMTITHALMLIILGHSNRIGIIIGALIPTFIGPAPLFLFLHLIFELDKMHQKYQHLANIDTLTQAYNRRYLLDQIKIEIERSKRYGTGFSLILMDCDNFKRVNDQYGHPVGDDFLIHLVAVCKHRTRVTDTIARIGGDEFMLLLPETTGEQATILAENLREVIPSSFELFKDQPGFVSLSFGVTSWHPGIEKFTVLFSKLDNALYSAKEHGKNKVIHYTRALRLKQDPKTNDSIGQRNMPD